MAPMLDIVQKRGIMAVFWGLVSFVWDLCNVYFDINTMCLFFRMSLRQKLGKKTYSE